MLESKVQARYTPVTPEAAQINGAEEAVQRVISSDNYLKNIAKSNIITWWNSSRSSPINLCTKLAGTNPRRPSRSSASSIEALGSGGPHTSR